MARTLFVLHQVAVRDGKVIFRIAQQPPAETLFGWSGLAGWTASNGWRFKICACPELNGSKRILYIRGTDRDHDQAQLCVREEDWVDLLEAVEEANRSMENHLFGAETNLEDQFFREREEKNPRSPKKNGV